MFTNTLALRRVRRVHTFVALVLAVALWLICTATASAQTFCAESSAGCAGTFEPTLATALTDAWSNGTGKDTIHLPAGTFDYGPITDPVNDPVDIVGAGPDLTVVKSSAPGDAVTLADPGSTMSQLAVHVTNTSAYRAIVLNGAIDHVKVTGPATSSTAIGVAVDTSKTATITNSSIDLAYGSLASSIGVQGSQWSTVNISDSDIRARTGVLLQSATGDIERSRLWGDEGIEATNGTYGFMRDSSVRTPGPSPQAGPEYGLLCWGPGANELDVVSSTIYGDGGVNSTGVALGPFSNSSAVAQLTETVVANQAKAAQIGGGSGIATLYTSWSAYDATRVSAGTHWASHDLNLAGVDPRFVDAASGDFRLRFDSPLVDAGDAAALTSGDHDRDGNQRIVDGGHGTPRVDMGALEYQHAAPTVSAQASPGAASVGQPVSFSATAADSDPDETPSIAWKFDDGTSASGADVTHTFATGGDHTATATATDPSGLTGSASAAVTVTAPSPAAATGSGGSGSGSGAAGGGQNAAPAITNLRLSPSVFRVLAARSSGHAAHGGSKLSFQLSQTANVMVTVQRAKGHTWQRVGSFALKRSAGATKVRFDGRVARKALRAGSYRMRVVARNQAGLASKAALVKFRIVRG